MPQQANTDWLNEPRMSISEFNTHMDQFAEQAAATMERTAKQAEHNTHIKSFMTMASILPSECAATLITADTVRAIATELQRHGH